jgi:transposase, IS30 family
VRYHQLTSEERYALAHMRQSHYSQAEIARVLGRHPSTISRELRRNRREDGFYRAFTADEKTRARRSRSRRNLQFTEEQWLLVLACLNQLWSPEQISGRLRRLGLLSISHETIYRYIWNDRWYGGSLHTYLRQDPKRLRKRYGRYDSRGRLAGKRSISERPAGAENRSRMGHLEGDTVIGTFDRHCILTLVCRKTGYTMIGKLYGRTTQAVNRRAASLIRGARHRVRSITVDNGTEFHGYKQLEKRTGAEVYFATPHHSWERGTSENTNGLIRQYLPKRTSMSGVTQRECSRIATALNNRPRKRLNYLTPAEVYEHDSCR